MRGDVPVRNNVSIVRADALFAFVKASAGLPDPAKSTIFCIVFCLAFLEVEKTVFGEFARPSFCLF